MRRVKITALETFTGATDPSGVAHTLYREGQEYEVAESLANLFIEGKLAAPVAAQEEDESADNNEEDEPTLKRRSKNKKRADWEE